MLIAQKVVLVPLALLPPRNAGRLALLVIVVVLLALIARLAASRFLIMRLGAFLIQEQMEPQAELLLVLPYRKAGQLANLVLQ